MISNFVTLRYKVEKLSETADGLWRSLVAHLTGGQGVVGSNPASPTESRWVNTSRLYRIYIVLLKCILASSSVDLGYPI